MVIGMTPDDYADQAAFMLSVAKALEDALDDYVAASPVYEAAAMLLSAANDVRLLEEVASE